MTGAIDIHRLAALPYGTAARECQRLGLWDDRLALPASGQRRYRARVTVTEIREVTGTITIDAADRRDAEDLLRDLDGDQLRAEDRRADDSLETEVTIDSIEEIGP